MTDEWLPAEHGSERGGLQQRVARGLTWTIVDNFGGQIVALLIFLLLASQLDPVDFGLVALAMVFIQFASIFVDQGLGDALIQRKALTRGQIDTAFWTAVFTGTLLTIGGYLLAGPISRIVGQPALEPILQALSLVCLLAAFTSIQMALLRREMQFRNLAIRRVTALTVGGVAGVTLAFLGYGPWALVAQQLLSGTVSIALLWAISPWRPTLHVSTADFRSLFSFGINVVAADVLAFISRNSDNLLIGVVLGPAALGLYSVGFRILEVSQSLLVNTARKLVFPAFSRLQTDRERLRRAYARMTGLLSAVTLPGYIGLSLVVQQATVVLLGDEWAASGTVASVLFLIGPVLTVQGFAGALLAAVGRPDISLRFRFISTVTNIVGFAVAVLVFGNILAVAAAYVIRGYLLTPIILWWLQVYGGIPLADNLVRVRGIALATALMAGAIIAVKLALSSDVSSGVLLAIEVPVGIVVYCVALVALEPGLVREARAFGLQAIPGGDRRRAALGSRRGLPPPPQPETPSNLTMADELDEI